jgi:hypothetical protein
VRRGHDFPAQAGRSQTWILIMVENSTDFHSCLIAIYITVAGQAFLIEIKTRPVVLQYAARWSG